MRLIAAVALLALVAADVPDLSVPAEFGLVEGVAWDARSRQLFAGSVEDGALLVREGDHWRRAVLPFPTAGLFGMAVDPRRGILWIASGVAGPTRRKDAFRGLIGVSALGFEAVGMAAVPAGDITAQPGDVAIAPDGSVYVSDGAAGGVYVCKPDCTQLGCSCPKVRFGVRRAWLSRAMAASSMLPTTAAACSSSISRSRSSPWWYLRKKGSTG
ncbi:MAG: hypothetical protein IPF48_04485 [Sphingomonadales bacterium]|nr:hypothetical protein [Sphingomonadales bacterium]